jgi:hypothetical protein
MDADKKVSEGLVCPECGADMAQLDPMGHSLTHYPEFLDPAKSSPKARASQKAILAGGVSKAVYLKKFEQEG